MIGGKPKGRFAKILLRADIRILLFFSYVSVLLFFLIKGQWLFAFFVHLLLVVIYGLAYFGYDFLQSFLSPITIIVHPIDNFILMRYLKKFKQNIPAATVIILGQSDWLELEGWLKPNFFKNEIESLVRYLNAKGQNFSFYTHAKFDDIEKIMSNKDIKEVYFFGHGDSHVFQLNTDEILYYCEFNNPDKYGKEFVHQVHCGTLHGKSLIDYVVPKENRAKCFFFRKSIDSFLITKEFKKRLANIEKP